MTRPRSSGSIMAAALLGPLLVGAALIPLRGLLENTNLALVLVLVVVAVAAAGHRPSGVLAALSAALWFDFFLTEPYYGFTITDRADVETAVLLVLVGTAVAEIAAWGRRQQGRSSVREGYLGGLVASARLAAAGDTTPTALASFVSDQLIELLDLDSCRYEPGGPTSRARLNSDGSVTHEGHTLDVDRHGLPTIGETELPVEHRGRIIGRFVMASVTQASRPTLEQRLVAVTLADQAAPSLATAT